IIDDDSDEQPLPHAPAGVTAKKGPEKSILTWEPVSNATSYNIYFATTSGVMRTNGQKIANVVSPFNHTSLLGGIAYYYVVTANNSEGESQESVEVTATPDKADYAPDSALAPNTISTLSAAASVYEYSSNGEKVSIKIPVEHGADVNYALVVLNSSNVTQSIQLKPESLVFSGSDQESESVNEASRFSRLISAYSGNTLNDARINQYQFETQMRQDFIESLRRASGNGNLRNSIIRASDHSGEKLGDIVNLNIIVAYMFGQTYSSRRCKLVRMTDHCKIFVDQDAYDGLSAAEGAYAVTEDDLNHIAGEFDTFIYPLMNQNYGRVYDIDGDGRLSIVFSPVYPKIGFAGLFNTLHMNPTNPANSNQRDMLGIWSPHALSSSTSTGEKWRMDARETIVHEMQHAINFSAKVFPNDVFRFPDDINFNANEDSYLEAMWLDESLSVGAEARYRLVRGQSSVYEARFDSWAKSSPHTYGLTSWAGVLGHYGQKGLFNYYLFEQHGSEKIKAVVQNTSTGIDNLEAIYGRSIRELAKNFSLAVINESLRHKGLTSVGSIASAYKFSQPIDLDLAEQVVTMGYTPNSLSVPAMGTAYYLIKQPAAFNGGDEFQFRIESSSGKSIDLMIMRLPKP
ncbi:MAG TPA: hypothetical protein DCG57_16930, partial [Candidatus Riflebacteria bacterium]|nr:hypothetical protein [Candidatus Riflebacteria bacterium]